MKTSDLASSLIGILGSGKLSALDVAQAAKVLSEKGGNAEKIMTGMMALKEVAASLNAKVQAASGPKNKAEDENDPLAGVADADMVFDMKMVPGDPTRAVVKVNKTVSLATAARIAALIAEES